MSLQQSFRYLNARLEYNIDIKEDTQSWIPQHDIYDVKAVHLSKMLQI